MERTKHHQKQGGFNVLACDPSLTAWGWAVLTESSKILYMGCIKTASNHKKLRIRKGDDTISRITEITETILSVIRTYKIKYIVSELPHGSQSSAAADAIGIVKGIMQSIAICNDIGIEWYSEGDSKLALLKKCSGEKIETMMAIDKHYDVPTTKGTKKNAKGQIVALWTGISYIDEAVADSLSIHYTASLVSPVLKAMKGV